MNGDMKTIGKMNDSPKEALLQGLIFEADRIVEEFCNVTQKERSMLDTRAKLATTEIA